MPADWLAPASLRPDHDLAGFENGRHPSLDAWLRQRALACEGLTARTYVVGTTHDPLRVVGYHALSTAMEDRAALPSAKLRSGTPERIPLLLIGRLAVDHRCRGVGLGGALLGHALDRCVAAADIIGVRGIVAHAIDDAAAAFYAKYGFLASPLGDRLLLLPIESARALRRRPGA